MLQAKQQGLVPRCLAVITPGNPTGQVIEQDNQEELIKFAKDHDLVIIADEVYQVSFVGSGHISGSVTVRSETTAGRREASCSAHVSAEAHSSIQSPPAGAPVFGALLEELLNELSVPALCRRNSSSGVCL